MQDIEQFTKTKHNEESYIFKSDHGFIKVYFPKSAQKLNGLKEIIIEDFGHQKEIVLRGTHDTIKYDLVLYTTNEEKVIIMNENNKVLARF